MEPFSFFGKESNNFLTNVYLIISILPNDSEKQANIQKIELAAQMGADFSSLGIIKKQIIDLVEKTVL